MDYWTGCKKALLTHTIATAIDEKNHAKLPVIRSSSITVVETVENDTFCWSSAETRHKQIEPQASQAAKLNLFNYRITSFQLRDSCQIQYYVSGSHQSRGQVVGRWPWRERGGRDKKKLCFRTLFSSLRLTSFQKLGNFIGKRLPLT